MIIVKTITLTESEIKTLYDYLWCNPCNIGCVCDYKRVNCYDMKKDGVYKCRLQRDTDSILKKLST